MEIEGGGGGAGGSDQDLDRVQRVVETVSRVVPLLVGVLGADVDHVEAQVGKEQHGKPRGDGPLAKDEKFFFLLGTGIMNKACKVLDLGRHARIVDGGINPVAVGRAMVVALGFLWNEVVPRSWNL